MPPRRNKKSVAEEEGGQLDFGNSLKMLTSVLNEISTNMKNLNEDFKTEMNQIKNDISNNKVTERNINSENVENRISCNSEIQTNSLGISTGNVNNTVMGAQKLDRSYITAWKDLGVIQCIFHQGDSKKASLAIAGLRGSAADWGQLKEGACTSFEVFEELFLARYWGVREERELFQKIKYGTYERGSLSEYFLKIIKEARYLSDPLSEGELVVLVSKHFPMEIRRGILNNGFQSIDDVEIYLRNLDELENDRSGLPRFNNNTRVNQNVNNVNRDNFNRARESNQQVRSRENNSGVPRENNSGASRENNSGMSRENNPSVALVCDDFSEVLEEKDLETNSIPLTPVVHFSIESEPAKVLIDSGSQITDNIDFDYTCIIVPKLIKDVILGCDWFLDFDIKLDIPANFLQGKFNNKIEKVIFPGEFNPNANIGVSELIIEKKIEYEVPERYPKPYTEDEISKQAMAAEALDEVDKRKLKDLLILNKKLFSEEPGLTKAYFHEIQLHDYTPFFIKSYPIAYVHRDEVKRQINQMLDWGIIKCQQTEFVSPLVVVTKKDGSVRICLDARYLNQRMVKDHVMPPNPNELLFDFTKNQILTTMDLSASYWQVPIKEDHQKYVGFSYDGAVVSSELSKVVKGQLKNIEADQRDDVFCKSIMSRLNEPQISGSSINPVAKLCIPKSHIINLVKQEHNDNGHFGATKCFDYLKRHYYFPKMRERIRRIIASCDLCQKSKIAPHLAGPMHNVIVENKNELVCLDLVGPLPVSRGGATQLLVIVDAFSKYVALYALKKATSKSILNVLENKYFPIVGKPLRILSDNATQFSSKLWLKKLKELDIKISHTSVYYPAGNMTERVNREVGRLLRSICYNKHTQWAFKLKQVELWLNGAIHSSTGFSPNELHFSKLRENPFLNLVSFPGGSDYLGDVGDTVILAREKLKAKAQKKG
ncbi:hypothetical protein NQ314_020561 [Rhamnusium bicolor]|uniref:RNA-directed DNA polymerase n=1 Tax=Rhamnusium bicolor TaxID=1586634 RepID=A0AAV8WKW1_9CUCU|nr:hypothetical protein NQ314_020561 [Rhamnusium bicolor]